MNLSEPMKGKGVTMYLVNPSAGDVAATLKTSNHRAGNIIDPRGGRAEMGVLEIDETSPNEFLSAAIRGRMKENGLRQELEVGEDVSFALLAGFTGKNCLAMEIEE